MTATLETEASVSTNGHASIRKASKKPVKTSKKDTMSPKDRKQRDAAKACGLSLVQYRILSALRDHGQLTYRGIEAKTGYYSILTAQLRKEHEDSLGHAGLIRETTAEGDNSRETLAFEITARGKQKLAKS